MDTIELHEAFMWDCDNCGVENFERAVRPELTEEEIQELKDEVGIMDEEEGIFLMAPKTVTCSKCGTQYQTEEQT
jgi:DNA-directed RNA polymerase subunit M/transcription elongation factor TFIIS